MATPRAAATAPRIGSGGGVNAMAVAAGAALAGVAAAAAHRGRAAHSVSRALSAWTGPSTPATTAAKSTRSAVSSGWRAHRRPMSASSGVVLDKRARISVRAQPFTLDRALSSAAATSDARPRADTAPPLTHATPGGRRRRFSTTSAVAAMQACTGAAPRRARASPWSPWHHSARYSTRGAKLLQQHGSGGSAGGGASSAAEALLNSVPVESRAAIDIQNEARDLWMENLVPVNARMMGPLGTHSDELTKMPMVLLLGNHSSGKSSFINYVLEREVQETGVAPTDDGFTIIAPGSQDMDQDGPALIGDEALGFKGLRAFGATLINHVRLKIRTALAVSDIMIVDSPGMIDSPVPLLGTDRSRDRGYAFTNVIRWFAERADVILLFFDPDKPGTTGETLDAMTTSLAGLDHKVHIVLNKVDQFDKVHDFARAYGSLCWNLSKVIPRKDLPRIYTMCIPTDSPTTTVLTDALPDLESARAAILDEVHKAPLRRVDNSITRLYDAARLLSMHVTVMDAVRRQIRNVRMKWLSLAALVAGSGAAVGVPSVLYGMWELGGPMLGLGLAGGIGVYVYGQRQLTETQNRLTSKEGLFEVFQHEHLMPLAQGDEFLVSLWERVLPQVQVSMATLGATNIPKLSAAELRGIEDIITHYVPELRRAATKSGAIVFDDSFAHRQI